jgi:peptidoglycan/LPS O-acetylase OafA/YrhL
MVIACHYPMFSQLTGVAHLGWIGVDVFFVLSGFLITDILLRLKAERWPIIRFYARRTARILPPFFAVLGSVLLINRITNVKTPDGFVRQHFLFLSSFQHTGETLRRIWSVLTGSASIPALFGKTPLQLPLDGFVPARLADTVGVDWSLSVEEYFYLIWAPIVLFLRRNTAARIAVCAIVFSIAYRWLGFTSSNFGWQLDFLCRFDALGMGALLAMFPHVRASGSTLVCCAAAVLGLMCVRNPSAVLREGREAPEFGIFGYTLIAIASAGLIAMLLESALPKSVMRLFSSRPMIYAGQRSYMLYLIHSPVYYLIGLSGLRPAFTGLLSLVVCLVIAHMSWELFERPIMATQSACEAALLRRLQESRR